MPQAMERLAHLRVCHKLTIVTKASHRAQRTLTRFEFFIHSPGPEVYIGTVQRYGSGWIYDARRPGGGIFFAGGTDCGGVQATPHGAMLSLLRKLDRAWGWNWNGNLYLGADPADSGGSLRYVGSVNASPQVILLAGASGVGKTSVSYRLAHQLHFGLTEVDDFQVILENMTTEEQYPAVHYWRAHNEEARRMTPEGMLAHMVRYSETMAVALELVIANHIESQAPVVLEGDFILPSLAVRPEFNGIPADGQVRAAVLYEEDEAQIAGNYLAREGEEQPRRAHISWRHSEWLRSEAERLGIPAVPARPWDTVLQRLWAAVGPFDTTD